MSAAPPVAPPASRRWPGLAPFARFAVLKAGTQGLAVVQGFLVINLLAKHEYGIYAIAFAAISAAAVIAGAGLDMFITSVGGRHVEDQKAFREVTKGAYEVQGILTLLGIAVLAAMLPLQLWRAGADRPSMILVCLLAPAVMWLQVHIGMQRSMLSIRLQLERNQILEMISSFLRISGFLALSLLPMSVGAVTFLSVNLATVLLQNRLQLRSLGGWINGPTDESNLKQRSREAMTMSWQQIPNTSYWAFQSQIPYLLMSVLGNLTTVAEFAALGRLSLVLGFFFDVTIDWMAPRIGRCKDSQQLRRLVLGIAIGTPVAAVVLLSGAWLARGHLVSLLGREYAVLLNVFHLALICVGLSFYAGMLYRVCAARAWLGQSWILMTSNLITQVVSALVFPVGTVEGVLLFQIAPLCASNVVLSAMLVVGLARDQRALNQSETG